MKKRRIFITGVSGFLGNTLVAEAQKEWECHGSMHIHPVTTTKNVSDVSSGSRNAAMCAECAMCVIHPCDVTDPGASRNVLHTVKPDAVIFCAAASQPNFCEQNPDVSSTINVDAPQQWAKMCAELAIPFVFTSTDLVFDGQNGPYSEQSNVAPVNIYGEQKVLAERKILAAHQGATICRMPLMYGDQSLSGVSFLTSIYSKLKQGTQQSLFSDEIRTVASGIRAAKGLLLCLEKNIEGIIHLGGRERISRYEFGLRLAKYCGFSTSLITAGKQSDVVMPARRPADVSLDSSFAFSIGYNPLPLEEFASLSVLK